MIAARSAARTKTVVLSSALAWALALATIVSARAAQIVFPDGDGKAEFIESCGGCHDLAASVVKRHTIKEWDDVMTAMKAKGISTPDDDLKQIAVYLSRHFGLVNVNKASAEELKRVLGITANNADAIVAHRDNHGAFNSLDDLKAVPGIDAEAIEREKASIVFGGA